VASRAWRKQWQNQIHGGSVDLFNKVAGRNYTFGKWRWFAAKRWPYMGNVG